MSTHETMRNSEVSLPSTLRSTVSTMVLAAPRYSFLISSSTPCVQTLLCGMSREESQLLCFNAINPKVIAVQGCMADMTPTDSLLVGGRLVATDDTVRIIVGVYPYPYAEYDTEP